MPYVKVWTDLYEQEWFLEMPGIARSIYLQLIVIAKREGDTGRILRTNLLGLCGTLALDPRTVCKHLTKMSDLCKIKIHSGVRNSREVVSIELVKYQHFQSLKEKVRRTDSASSQHGPNKNVGLLEQSREDKSRAEQQLSEHKDLRRLVERLQMDPQLEPIIGRQVPRDFLNRLLNEFEYERIDTVVTDLSEYVGGLKYAPGADKLRNWLHERCSTWKGGKSKSDPFAEFAARGKK